MYLVLNADSYGKYFAKLSPNSSFSWAGMVFNLALTPPHSRSKGPHSRSKGPHSGSKGQHSCSIGTHSRSKGTHSHSKGTHSRSKVTHSRSKIQARKVSEKQDRAIYAKLKLSVIFGLAQNCFWTHRKPQEPWTSYKKAKINSNTRLQLELIQLNLNSPKIIFWLEQPKNDWPESRMNLAWYNVHCSLFIVYNVYCI